jgi:hypothetical protein
MIIGSSVGNLFLYYLFFEITLNYISDKTIITTLLILIVIFQIIAESGGIAVIVGTFLISVEHYKYGKFLSSLGTGIGVIGLLALIILSFYLGLIVIERTLSLITIICGGSFVGFIGLILSIIARKKLGKMKNKDVDPTKIINN